MRMLARVAVCAATIGISPALASAAPPQPAAALSPAPACEMPAEIAPVEAFAHAVDDPRSLAFFAYVANLEGKARDRVLGHLRAALPLEATDEIAHVLETRCAVPEIAYRSTRLIYALSTRWNGEDTIALQRQIRFAYAALVLGDAISAKTRDETLAYFDTSVTDLDARLAEASAAPPAVAAAATDATDATQTALCRTIEAKATKAVTPEYPATAQAVGAGGLISMSVSLDPHGFVRAIAFLKSSAPDRPASGALLTVATIAAGSSNYTPKFVACKPVASTYVFRAEFDPKPQR